MKKGRKTANSKTKAAEMKQRIIAYLLDLFLEVISLGGFLLSAGLYFVLDPRSPQGSFQMLCFLITFLLLFLYIPYRNKGQTIGKLLLHIQVISDTGSEVGIWKFCFRESFLKLGFAILVIPVGVVTELCYLLRYHKCPEFLLNDMFLHTRVIKAL